MSLKNVIPSVKAQAEEEEELVDPQVTLKEKCGAKKSCEAFKSKLDTCNDRVNSRTKTSENCSEELFDYFHCVDHCVAQELFKYLK